MTPASGPRYVIVSPVRDEAGRVEQTIASVLRQTIRPVQWVLVNDGSTDGTGAILDGVARAHAWITTVHLPGRAHRDLLHAAEMAAFHHGWSLISATDWEFAVKLDADLVLPADYFARCLDAFRRDPRLGVAGGSLYHLENGRHLLEAGATFHVRGATKIYRRACWEAIGGPPAALGWDALDELKAQMLGWDTRSLPDVRALHLRRTGGADGTWNTAFKDGRASYMAGYHPIFLVLKALHRLRRCPRGSETMGLLSGFLVARLRRLHRHAGPELVRFVRQQQIRRLLGQPSMWH